MCFVFGLWETERPRNFIWPTENLPLCEMASTSYIRPLAKYFISKWNKTPLHLQHLGCWKRVLLSKCHLGLLVVWVHFGYGGSEKAPSNIESPLSRITEKCTDLTNSFRISEFGHKYYPHSLSRRKWVVSSLYPFPPQVWLCQETAS